MQCLVARQTQLQEKGIKQTTADVGGQGFTIIWSAKLLEHCESDFWREETDCLVLRQTQLQEKGSETIHCCC